MREQTNKGRIVAKFEKERNNEKKREIVDYRKQGKKEKIKGIGEGWSIRKNMEIDKKGKKGTGRGREG